MNTVVCVLAGPIPTAQGPTSVVQHGKVTDYKVVDGWLRLKVDGGAEVAYNLNLVITYSVDPHGSIVKPDLAK